MSITTAFSFKKKYPGKIFIEAATEKDVRDSLDGFVDVNLGQIRMMDEESYSSLFDLKEEAIISFRKDNFVRIRKGVYADDLGRICKIKKHSVDVLLVPRLNLQEVLTRMKEETSKLSEEK